MMESSQQPLAPAMVTPETTQRPGFDQLGSLVWQDARLCEEEQSGERMEYIRAVDCLLVTGVQDAVQIVDDVAQMFLTVVPWT